MQVNGDLGVECLDGEARRFGFHHSEPAAGVDHLSLEVGFFEAVGVGDSDGSHSGGGEIGQYGGSQSSRTDDEDACRSQCIDSLSPDSRDTRGHFIALSYHTFIPSAPCARDLNRRHYAY